MSKSKQPNPVTQALRRRSQSLSLKTLDNRIALHRRLAGRFFNFNGPADLNGLSLRSRRQHKAWGVSPRLKHQKQLLARGAGDRNLECGGKQSATPLWMFFEG
jgi:hypothetical protein